MEPDGEDQEASATQEQQTEKEQQEKETVRIVEEEDVRDNLTFAAFIDITAYDDMEGTNRYIYDYYADYTGIIDGIYYMAEDLNQDAKNELLICIEGTWGFENLLVFEETESGELIAWRIWKTVLNDRQPDVYYCGMGMLMIDGVLGTAVGHYTPEGTPEILMDYYHKLMDNNDAYYVMSIWLRLYENGEVVREMEYERYCDMETQEDIIELESKEVREGEKLADEILAALGEKKEVSIDGAEYREEYKDRVKLVLLDELQSP